MAAGECLVEKALKWRPNKELSAHKTQISDDSIHSPQLKGAGIERKRFMRHSVYIWCACVWSCT